MIQPQSIARAVLTNSAWLIADRIVRMGLGLLVTVWLARQFGPELFGVWNYAMAIALLFGVVATLGLDGVVVRELLRDKANAGAIMGTALALRAGAAVLALGGAVLVMLWTRPSQPLVVLLVALNAAVLVFQSAQVIEYHFQARMKSKPAVVAANAAFLVSTVCRVILLFLGASIEWFGAFLVFEAALGAALLYVVYRADVEDRQVWRVDLRMARRLLAESWPLILSGLAVIVYMRMDQVMLSSMVGDAAVGQFSAALRIAEVWYFIPMAIMTAAFPAMIQKRADGPQAFEAYVQRLYDMMAWLGLLVAASVTALAPSVVPLIYGPAYVEAATVLSIQIWAGVAVSMSFVHSKWLLSEGLQKYGLVYTLVGACVNISLNLVLIPRHGAVGAAWATLITQFAPLLIQLFFPKARRNFMLMLLTVGAPWRLLLSMRIRKEQPDLARDATLLR
ncbi:MAG: flippase [Caldimonas sp.]